MFVQSIMLGLFACILTSACFSTGRTLGSTDFGVGFNLALDYGVASVHFPNGTAVDIAKIEGGQGYKAAMRANDNHIGMISVQQPVLGDHLHLPDWLGGDGNRKSARSRALSLMLKGLKTTTESYLDSKMSYAEVTVPFPVSEGYIHDLRQAAASVSLHIPLFAPALTGIMAASAHGMVGECPAYPDDASLKYDPEQLILTIDYSRAALTALLIDEECGVFEYQRVIHDTRLGLDGLLEVDGATAASLLEAALRNITSLPLKSGNGAGLEHISNLVIIGESANDSRLHDSLGRVLSEPFTSVASGKNGLSPPMDPIFSASRCVAWRCWFRLNSSAEGMP